MAKTIASPFVEDNSIARNSFLSFPDSEKTVAAWSMLRGHAYIFATLSTVSMVVLSLPYEQLGMPLQKVRARMVFDGIFGNTRDKNVRGCVVDFKSIDLKFHHRSYSIFPRASFLLVS
jgi:lipoprotein signal peptidase